ncbi:hypothetical protein GW746_00995 [Candidatus Saccharibacteria bacterium]|nr:hypothetical protein [Candidatus Saccharibacteria bacterium]NCS82981.1 hypothetical protein [Candidatus Saccharibacteria bacterium]
MDKSSLFELYHGKGMSMAEIAHRYSYSVHKVDYWMRTHGIPRRTRSEALYVKNNGLADPFFIKPIRNAELSILYGMGIGLYWGEGNKRNLNAVRLGNTDPGIIKTFVSFLIKICSVSPGKIRYGLQVFSDIAEDVAVSYWLRELQIGREQIMPTVSYIKSGKIGTYKRKNQYGVMTVYVYNTKLRNWMVDQLVTPR